MRTNRAARVAVLVGLLAVMYLLFGLSSSVRSVSPVSADNHQIDSHTADLLMRTHANAASGDILVTSTYTDTVAAMLAADSTLLDLSYFNLNLPIVIK